MHQSGVNDLDRQETTANLSRDVIIDRSSYRAGRHVRSSKWIGPLNTGPKWARLPPVSISLYHTGCRILWFRIPVRAGYIKRPGVDPSFAQLQVDRMSNSVCGLVMFLVVVQAAAAGPVDQWGAYVEATANAFSDPSLATFQGTDGGLRQDTATYSSHASAVSSDDAGRVSAFAELSRSTGIGLPVLRARAESFHAPAASNAFAGAIEGYAFQGSGPENFQLHVTLTGTVTGNANISGMAGVLDTESFTFDVSNAFEFTSIGDTIASMFIDENRPGAKTTVINFTLTPGQEFYIAANLSASASGVGGEASSLNTLTTSISGSAAGLAGLTSSSVPEPAALALLQLVVCTFSGRRWASVVLEGR